MKLGRTEIALIVSSVICVMCIAIFQAISPDLPATCERLPGLAELLLSFGADTSRSILAAWQQTPAGIGPLRTALAVDSIFPAAYATFLFSLTQLVLKHGGRHGGRPLRLPLPAPVIAAFFDY